MSKAVDDLVAQVAANTSVESSAAQAIQGILVQLQAAHDTGDLTKIGEAIQALQTSAGSLSAAVATVPTP